MKASLYYVTNRNHLGSDRFHPTGYGIHPSADGIENLRFGKVTVDVGAKSLDRWFNAKTASGKGDGEELSEHLTKRAETHSTITAYPEKIPDKERPEHNQPGVKLGSRIMLEEIQGTMREGRDVLIFVHGFNVSWHSAVGSALALQAMLNRPGIREKGKGDVMVILYTWPSDGSALPFVAYRSDRTEAIGSGFALGRGLLKLRDFLKDTTRVLTAKEKEKGERREPCNQNINLLCHSMGNYVLQHALQRMIERTDEGRLPKLFDHIFLCAPDVDENVLEPQQPMGKLHQVCQNVNVYFNRGDLALRGSDYTKGNPDRLGTSGAANHLLIHRKVYQIDCSGDIVKGLIEHSYYLKGRINADIRMSLDNIPQDNLKKRSRKPGEFPHLYQMI